MLAVRALTLSGGVCACWGALFLYESQERQIQNILEAWWIRVDDISRGAVSRHTGFARATAELTQAGLDRLFGSKLLSLRAIFMSFSLSVTSLFVIAALIMICRDSRFFYGLLNGVATILIVLASPVIGENDNTVFVSLLAVLCIASLVVGIGKRLHWIAFGGAVISTYDTYLEYSFAGHRRRRRRR